MIFPPHDYIVYIILYLKCKQEHKLFALLQKITQIYTHSKHRGATSIPGMSRSEQSACQAGSGAVHGEVRENTKSLQSIRYRSAVHKHRTWSGSAILEHYSTENRYIP